MYDHGLQPPVTVIYCDSLDTARIRGRMRALKKATPGESRARKVTGLKAQAYGSGIAKNEYAPHSMCWQLCSFAVLLAPLPGFLLQATNLAPGQRVIDDVSLAVFERKWNFS